MPPFVFPNVTARAHALTEFLWGAFANAGRAAKQVWLAALPGPGSAHLAEMRIKVQGFNGGHWVTRGTHQQQMDAFLNSATNAWLTTGVVCFACHCLGFSQNHMSSLLAGNHSAPAMMQTRFVNGNTQHGVWRMDPQDRRARGGRNQAHANWVRQFLLNNNHVHLVAAMNTLKTFLRTCACGAILVANATIDAYSGDNGTGRSTIHWDTNNGDNRVSSVRLYGRALLAGNVDKCTTFYALNGPAPPGSTSLPQLRAEGGDLLTSDEWMRACVAASAKELITPMTLEVPNPEALEAYARERAFWNDAMDAHDLLCDRRDKFQRKIALDYWQRRRSRARLAFE